MTSSDRLPVLDGIRGLAILMIMQYHFWGLGFGIVDRKPLLAVDRWVSSVRELGWTSVDLFFVLSGFLITGILVDAKGRSQHYFRNFYARRFLRIFPLYYLFLSVMLTVAARIPPVASYASTGELQSQEAWFWTYLVNVAASVPACGAQIPVVYTHFWTLSLEEQFYLAWPFVVLALNERQLTWLCCLMIPTALLLRVAVVLGAFSLIVFPNAAHVLTPARMDTLALGALVALAARGAIDLRRLARLAPYVASACAACIVLLFLVRRGLPLFDPFALTIGFTIVDVMWAAVLVLAITAPGLRLCRALAHPGLRMFGRYSYCIYIVHLLVGFALAVIGLRLQVFRTFAGSQIPMNLVLSATATAVCLGIGLVSWNLIEKQFLRLKVWFPYETRVVPAAASPRRSRVPETPAASS